MKERNIGLDVVRCVAIILPLVFVSSLIINKVSKFIYIKFRFLYDKICLWFSKRLKKGWKKLIKG